MLRPATDDDAMSILRWRNHEKVRRLSIYTAHIPVESHLKWWASVKADPTKRVLIYTYDGVPSGVVRFEDIHTDPGTGEKSATWGFFLDTDSVEASPHALRIWVQVEKEALDYAFDVLGVQVLSGVTLGSNVAVRQLHRRFGLTEPGSYFEEIDGVPTEIFHNEIRVENRRGSRQP